MSTIKLFLSQLKDVVEYNVKDFGKLCLFILGLLYISYQDPLVILIALRVSIILLVLAVLLTIVALSIKQTHDIKTDKRRVKKYINKSVDK